jgi:hypothetical protein
MTDSPTPRPNGFSEATGEICYDLPSAYIPHPATGLLHLPRFLGKFVNICKASYRNLIKEISVKALIAFYVST